MSFFKQFPNTFYQFQANQPRTIKDFFRHVDVNDRLASGLTTYTKYNVLDGERPDHVSQKLYGTPDFYWTFFIVNESLKNGIDDWPKASNTLEAEFTLEYDPISSMVVVPRITNENLEAYNGDELGNQYITNSLNGINLDYADLRITRNYETAKIVNWDSDMLMLNLTDFTNRGRFLETDPQGLLNIANRGLIGVNENVWAVDSTSRMLLTFNDWPIIGKNKEDGSTFFPKSSQTGGEFTSLALKTMTEERTDWMIEFFQWYDSVLTNINIAYPQESDGYTEFPYKQYLIGRQNKSKSRREVALEVFITYFWPYSKTGACSFNGFRPFVDTRGVASVYTSMRNAPAYFYEGEDFTNKINAYDVFRNKRDVDPQSVQTSPNRYISHYQQAVNQNDIKSQIKVVKPELIFDFVTAYKELINEGAVSPTSTKVVGITPKEPRKTSKVTASLTTEGIMETPNQQPLTTERATGDVTYGGSESLSYGGGAPSAPSGGGGAGGGGGGGGSGGGGGGY